jgi:hypothetical protein
VWRPGRARSASLRATLCEVHGQPADDALLGLDEVAAWLEVDAGWVARAIARDALPVLGFGSRGEPVIVAAEVRAWLRRPDPHGDET